MNWDALGAMGELFGALAVVLTLGYLAVQIRQNSDGMKVAAKLDIEKNFNEYTDLILRDTELLELQVKGLAVLCKERPGTFLRCITNTRRRICLKTNGMNHRG
jgi:hypothetical protein